MKTIITAAALIAAATTATAGPKTFACYDFDDSTKPAIVHEMGTPYFLRDGQALTAEELCKNGATMMCDVSFGESEEYYGNQDHFVLFMLAKPAYRVAYRCTTELF